MPVPYSAKAVANYFLDRSPPKSGGAVTQMKLHKLLYFAHGWHFAFRDQPLLDELIEAWKYGPVVPSLFHEFKDFGSRPILRKAFDVEICRGNELALTAPRIGKDDDFVRRRLDRIWEVYGMMNAGQLSHIVHLPSSPWTLARKKYALIRNAPILNEEMLLFFKNKRKENENVKSS